MHRLHFNNILGTLYHISKIFSTKKIHFYIANNSQHFFRPKLYIITSNEVKIYVVIGICDAELVS